MLGVGGFLGIGEKDVAVTMQAIEMMPEGDTTRLVVDASKEHSPNDADYGPAEAHLSELRPWPPLTAGAILISSRDRISQLHHANARAKRSQCRGCWRRAHISDIVAGHGLARLGGAAFHADSFNRLSGCHNSSLLANE